MYFALMGKLSARRQNLTADKDKGFTLIELLVVVIIIGILAAIAIPVYLGVQNNAKDSAVQSDVTNAKTAAVSIQTGSGALPTSKIADIAANADWKSAGTTKSTNTTTLSYAPDGTTNFCIYGKGTTNSEFFATSETGVTKVDATHALPAACK